jgi:hypothetical protein
MHKGSPGGSELCLDPLVPDEGPGAYKVVEIGKASLCWPCKRNDCPKTSEGVRYATG